MKLTTKQNIVTSILIASICMPSVGCKSMSSWQMPGASFFSASREPDPETLAGPSADIQIPESPAAKYEPTNIAANSAAGTKSATSNPYGGYPAQATAQTPNSPYGSSTTGSAPSAYGSGTKYPAQTVSTGTQTPSGLAAQANGYQTGPYPMSASPSATSGPASYSNPYGSSSATPTTAAPSAYSGSPLTASLPTSPATTSPSTALPSAPTYPNTNLGQPTASPQFPPIPSAGATSTGSAATGLPSSLPSAAANTTLPAAPGAASTPVLQNGYTPGTTARSTKYDFSGQSTSSSMLPPNTAASGVPVLR